ncbi:reverse transcriptase domain-containing protein [Tanacetum coccineum]
MVPATTPLIGFSGEIIWPLQISLLVKIGDEEHSTSAWMNFVIVRSSSPYNGIIGRPRVRKIQAVPSTIIPIECAAVSGPERQPPAAHQAIEERIKVAINPDYPKQTIMIGSTLIEEGRNKLCDLLQRNLDVFAWKPADMTSVPRHIAEHRLNIREGCPPVRQKRRGQAADRKQAIQKEVEKLIDADIMKEVHYHSWENAYKGYHQIKMAKEDEEKTAFITSQGIFCYSKMPFGLRNARATYQRLVDKAFHKQIRRNLEVYVADLVIKIRTEDEIIIDIKETFKTLREINMKLNPKKCTFGVEEGMFLGYKVNTKGIKCTKKSDFHWTEEAKSAFKQMKQLIAELPTLTAPEEKEELIVYLAAAKEAISAVLMTEREAKQMPIYFVSRALRGPEMNYTSMEKLVLALVHASKRLKRYFQAHPIIVVMDQPIKQGQILSDFIVERPEEDSLDTPIEVEEELLEPWILFTDGSSYADGSGAGLILTNLEGAELTYALRFRFEATNNEDEYEALIAGLRIAEEMGVRNLQANVDSRLVANQVNRTYTAKEADMIRYLEKVRALANGFRMFLIKQVPKRERKKADTLSKITSTSFAHLSKQVLVEELKEKSINEVEVLAVVEEEGNPISIPFNTLHQKLRGRNQGKDRCKQQELDGRNLSSVIPAEIGMPTLRTAEVDMVQNDEALEINLDLLEERREQAAIREAKSKAKMEKYYNSKVRSTSFKPGDLVYRSNDASRVEEVGKLDPKWEGPNEVTEALGKGAYKLKDRDGKQLLGTWNVRNLKKCYVHEM